MGAGLDFFADRRVFWFGAVLTSAALPIVMAALHQAWVTLAPESFLAICRCVMAANGQPGSMPFSRYRF